MKEYIITIAIAALAAAAADILAPKEWDKYIRIIIGFLILSVLIAPVAEFRHVQIMPVTENYEINDEPLRDSVSEEMRRRVEKDIEQRIEDEYGVKASAAVEIEIDDEHKIRGVKAIKIRCWQNPRGMIERIKNVYGCDKVELDIE